MFSTYLVRSSFALNGATLALFSLLLASACPLRPLHAASFSSTLRLLAIVAEELGVDLKVVDLLMLAVAVDVVGFEFEVNLEEEDLYAGPTLILKAKVEEICWWWDLE